MEDEELFVQGTGEAKDSISMLPKNVAVLVIVPSVGFIGILSPFISSNIELKKSSLPFMKYSM